MTALDATTLPPFEPFRTRVNELLFGRLDEHVDRLSLDASQLRAFQTTRLRALLAHATANSPFHAERLAGIDPATFELSDLVRVPVMTKPEMMERFDDVVTDRRIRRADVERIIAATGDEPIPALGEYLVLTSGGSSGTRGIFLSDAATFAEFVASTIRPSRAATAGLAPPPGGVRMAVLAVGSPIHATATGRLIATGGPITSTSIPATLPFAEIVARVRDADPHVLLGYPSVVVRLAREQLAGRLQLQLLGITCSAENLTSEVRATIEHAFGVGVVNLFGSTEGLVGLSAPGEEPLNFASDCCIVELVDENDQPVPRGQTSDAILVTNLFNRVQPLIRYRVDDRFVEQPPAAEHGHLRAIVDGRASDMLRWAEVVVHPLTVTNEVIHTPAVVDYIVRQTATGVDIDVVTAAPVDLDALGARITADLERAGLPGPDVAVRTIDDIGRNPHTGKVARIVPLAGG